MFTKTDLTSEFVLKKLKKNWFQKKFKKTHLANPAGTDISNFKNPASQ